MAWWLLLVGVLAALAISFLLRPKVPHRDDSTKDWEDPTADAGRAIPVVFGTITVKGLNVLWFGNKSIRVYKTKA